MIKTIYENPIKTVVFGMLVGGVITNVVDSFTGYQRGMVPSRSDSSKKRNRKSKPKKR